MTTPTTDDRDRASEARHGGRYLTSALADLMERSPHLRAALAGEGLLGDGDIRPPTPPEAALGNVWRYSLSPSGSNGSGRDTTADYAADMARNGGGEGQHRRHAKGTTMGLLAAEDMVEWPIYRAAVVNESIDVEALVDYIARRMLPGVTYTREYVVGMIDDLCTPWWRPT